MRKPSKFERERAIVREMVEKVKFGINEQQTAPETEKEEVQDLDTQGEKIILNPQDTKEYTAKFNQTVSPRVKFNQIIIYPKQNEVKWSGTLTDYDVNWYFSLESSDGVYLTGDMIHVKNDFIEVITKLNGFYKNWSDEWGIKLTNEYSAKS